MSILGNKLPKILFCGMGRAGKDTACEYLSSITLLRNAGTTSKYLAIEVAKELNMSYEECYARRHESDEMRNHWYEIGNKIRENGPTTLVRKAFEHGEISGGVRAYDEIVACKKEGLVDIIVWVENNRVAIDPTVKFTSKECDLIIENNWEIPDFYDRLTRFAEFAKLPMGYAILDNRKVLQGDFSDMVQNIKISPNVKREPILECGRKSYFAWSEQGFTNI